jgi:serine/threonine protein kinase
MSRQSQLDELLVRWEDALRSGDSVSAEALCEGNAELLPELTQQIATLQRMYQLLEPAEGSTGRFEDTWNDSPEAPWPNLEGYECLGRLGSGGMGIVFRARQSRLGRDVAVKVLRGDFPNRQARSRFLAEAEAAAELQHPNIVQIYDVGEHKGRLYLVLEFVDGGNLRDSIAGNPQPEREAVSIIATIARALAVAHRKGIVHRDIKPSNVLLQRRADANQHSATSQALTQFRPKISDFGVAKRLGVETEMTLTGEWLGTPAYMAPEQISGNAATISPPTDIFALGVTLYELLVGRTPFAGPTAIETAKQVQERDPLPPSRLQPSVSADLDNICLKCLEKDPHLRYATADELADDLDRFLSGQPVVARPITPIQRVWRWSRRNRTTASLVAALLLTVCSGLTGITWKWRESEQALRHADANLNRARRAVDECLAMVGHGHNLSSLDHPATKQIRRELLDTAAGFYEEFLDDFEQNGAASYDHKLEAGTVLVRLAEACNVLGRRDEAIGYSERSANILTGLIPQRDTVALRESLSSIFYSLGQSYRSRGDFEAALTAYSTALAHHDRAEKIGSENAPDKQGVLHTRWARARTFDELGRHKDAVSDWEYVAEHAQPKLKPHLRIDLGCCYARIGDHLRALEIAEEVAGEEFVDEFILGGCTRLLSVSAAAADRDEFVDSEHRAATVDRCIELAHDCFERALELCGDRREELVAEFNKHEDFEYVRTTGRLDALLCPNGNSE